MFDIPEEHAGELTSAQRLRFVEMAMDAIAKSFDTNPGTKTHAEIKRRFLICYEIFKPLRYDLHWGMLRISDHLTDYLIAELNGANWEPEDRRCWVSSDG